MEEKNIKKSSKNKENKGIILIALLMSIKVLIIIVAITINLLSGDNGVLKKEETNENSQEEIEEMEEMEEDEIDENEYETMEEETENLVVNFKNINAENSNPAGTLPVKATVIEPDANKGIVIKDKNNNEWVWIEVPKDTVFSELTIDTTGELTDPNYEDIKNKLITYAGVYRNGSVSQIISNWTDEWYAMDGSTLVTASTSNLTDTQKALTNGCGLTYDEYKTTYQKMFNKSKNRTYRYNNRNITKSDMSKRCNTI